MNWDLTLRPEAMVEIADTSDWYEQQNPGLGDKFIDAVDVMLSALRQNPHQYQVASGQLRRAKLRRFPYGLLYVVSDREVTVVSCVHLRRDPKIWQDPT